MSELHHIGLAALAAGLRARRFSSVELAEAFLKRIEASQGTLNAFISVTRSQALSDAAAADRALAAGTLRPVAAEALLDVLARTEEDHR
jgi:aspartyl-tRNA(Asn)/glutamyl-tRNA(Gln) amidotransferase subunit A